MTAKEREVFLKLGEFIALVRNCAPVGPLRADGVAMSELLDGMFDKKRKTIGGESLLDSRLRHEWETK